jgi:hypothetical protein
MRPVSIGESAVPGVLSRVFRAPDSRSIWPGSHSAVSKILPGREGTCCTPLAARIRSSHNKVKQCFWEKSAPRTEKDDTDLRHFADIATADRSEVSFC